MTRDYLRKILSALFLNYITKFKAKVVVAGNHEGFNQHFKAVPFLFAFAISLLSQPTVAQTSCEVDHFYIGNRPAERNVGWHQEAQGITHDNDHWYITQQNRLWKIPATLDLGSSVVCGGSVLCKDLADTELGDEGYDHFGDLTFFRDKNNQGYLCIPVEYKDKKRQSVGYFRRRQFGITCPCAASSAQ